MGPVTRRGEPAPATLSGKKRSADILVRRIFKRVSKPALLSRENDRRDAESAEKNKF